MDIQWKNEWTVPAITGAVCLGVGIGIGYIVSNHIHKKTLGDKIESLDDSVVQLDFKFDRHIEDDTRNQNLVEFAHNMVIHAENQTQAEIHESLEEATQIFVDAIEKSRAHHPSNVFGNEPEGWDWAIEVANRNEEEPYIIHKDEYDHQEAEEYSQTSLTYYQGDDVLVNPDDTPIYDYKKFVGDNLKFGHGSFDPSIVYVRNTKLLAEYEIILDRGYYQVEVLGEEIERNLSAVKEPLQKFRPSD